MCIQIHSTVPTCKYTNKQHIIADRLRLTSSPLVRACLGEFMGTIILMIFGSGVLAQVILGDHGKHAHGTFISISMGWGFAVYMAVMFSGQCGSGHCNPAVTLAAAVVGKLPFRRIPFYTFFQVLGAFLGSLVVFALYREKITEYANLHDNGKLLVNSTGGIFVTNPSASHLTCFLDQILGTALLTAGAFAITDPNGWKLPDYLHPLHLAFMVYAIVGCFALNAGAALNPARDLGPRLMIFMFGNINRGSNSTCTWSKYFFSVCGPIVSLKILQIFRI
ncbi:unnamed protein product [Schistosoma margrebowiei]|uniref:Uncharacterized protein n=1 Tax=Schistosoma margrebowiei TaxID=48269 RepID=A0A183M896_9TREM|nr:unnamed protein product [Schistosoma margrebowiei]